MIKSMTGYGGAKGASGGFEISIELRSVNNRYLDCTIKMPRGYAAAEERLKALVQKYISRGKVEVYIIVDTSNADDTVIRVNKQLAGAYLSALREVSGEFGVSCSVNATDLVRFPDVLQVQKREVDTEALYTDIGEVLDRALLGFDDMRAREGARLSGDIHARLSEIERLTDEIEAQSPVSVAEYRRKLEARMKETLKNIEIDEARILMEVAVFSDRVAINEETVRLRSHIGQLRELLEANEPVGRKLDFLVQELNREANTIGSKGNDAEMSKLTVALKAEIEKIREQAQNIE